MNLKVPHHIALLGGKVKLKYFDKKEYLITIPALTQNNTLLKLPHKGIFTNNQTGDLLLKIDIVIPKKLTIKQAQLIKEAYKNDKLLSDDNSCFE